MERQGLLERDREHPCLYGDVPDGMRRELALHHLRDAQPPISEIAYLLGFAEAASFNRAFRRWTGRTPSEYRAGLGPGAVSTLVA